MARRLSLLDTFHMLKDGEKVVYEHAYTGEVQEAHGPDDFPYILGNEIGKRMLDVYKQIQTPWRQYCAIGSTSKLNVSEYDVTPSLMHGDLETNSTGLEEADETTILEHRTSRLVNERKRGFVIPRSVVVNDDLNFFSTVGNRLAVMAARTSVWYAIRANPILRLHFLEDRVLPECTKIPVPIPLHQVP